MLSIIDREFEIVEATIDGLLHLTEDGWEFAWNFEVQTAVKEFDGYEWWPRLYAESLRIELPEPVRWPGYVLELPDPYDGESDANFTLCIFQHRDAWDLRLAFGPWNGEQIAVTLDCLADAGWDEKYGNGAAIHVSSPFRFTGIHVSERSEELARERLAATYNLDQFLVEKSSSGGYLFRLRT